MPLFKCKIGAPDGTLQIRELEANDEEQVRSGLVAQGYRVFSIKRASINFLPGFRQNHRHVGNQELLTFNQELIVLLKAGMPIVPLLDAILEHRAKTGGTFFHILSQVREDVKSGIALSTALERHEGYFPPLYLASLRAGERTGDLPNIIQRYVVYLEQADVLRKKIMSSLLYPAILVVVAVLAISLLLVYVVPTFSQVYADSGSQLPLATRLLIDFSKILQKTAIIWVPGLPAAIMGSRHWCRTPGGRQIVDRWKLAVPVAGTVMFSYAVAGFARTLSTLLGSGIPLVESLRMSIGTLNNRILEQGMVSVVRQVEEGGKLTVALEKHHLMPPLALRMLGVGETTGALEEMLIAIAEHLEKAVEERVRILTTAIEPAVMVVMGVVIGFIIVAMYLPIFKLAGTVGS